MRRAESAERGYLLTEQAAFHDEFEQASQGVLPLLRQLQDQTRDNAAQQLALLEIIALSEARIGQFRQVLELSRDKKLGDATEIIRINAGAVTMNRIRELAETMRSEEHGRRPQPIAGGDRHHVRLRAGADAGGHLDHPGAALGESARRGRGPIVGQ
jgi:hypothetical protein